MIEEKVAVAVVVEDNSVEDGTTAKKGNGMCRKEMRAKNQAKNQATS
jgi:hypothetical protein